MPGGIGRLKLKETQESGRNGLGLQSSEDDGQPTHDRHVSCVKDHVHWIPDEILTILHVSHFTVAQSRQKLAKNVTRDA